MSSRVIIVVIVIFVHVWTSIAQASLTAYVGGDDKNVYLTNLGTGEQGVFTIGGIYGNFCALAISPIDGTVFAVADGSSFYRIDVAASNASYIGKIVSDGSMHNLAFTCDGTLYGLSNCTTLVTINTETAETTVIGDILPRTTVPSSQGFAIASTGQGIAWLSDGFSYCFMAVDLNDASGTKVGDYMSEYRFGGLDFAPEGTLYAWEAKEQKLYEVNMVDCSLIHRESFAYGGYGGFAIIPEPTTLFLLALGTTMLRRKTVKR